MPPIKQNGFLPSLGLSVADNFMSNVFADISNNRRMQRQMNAWREMNEYNKPINQIKRLNEAGLNPNLAYSSSGSANAGNATSSALVGDQQGYVSPLNKVLDKLSAFAQLKSVMLDNENKRKQGKSIDLENQLKEQEYDQRSKVNPLNIDALNAQIGNMLLKNEAQTISNEVARDTKGFEKTLREYTAKNVQKNWDILEENWKKSIAEVAIAVQQIENQKAMYDKIIAETKDFYASINLKASQVMLNNSLTRLKNLDYRILAKAGIPKSEYEATIAGINKSVAEYARDKGYFQSERDYLFYQNRYHGDQANAERGYLGYGMFMRGLSDAVGVVAPMRGMMRSNISPIVNYNNGYGYNIGTFNTPIGR